MRLRLPALAGSVLLIVACGSSSTAVDSPPADEGEAGAAGAAGATGGGAGTGGKAQAGTTSGGSAGASTGGGGATSGGSAGAASGGGGAASGGGGATTGGSAGSTSGGAAGAGGDPNKECPLPPVCDSAPPDPGPKSGWNDLLSNGIALLGAAHRGRDLFLNPGDPQWVIAKFAYGAPVDKDLKGEDVDLYLLRGCQGTWEKLGTSKTTQENAHPTVEHVDDTGGHVYFQIPADKALGLGRHRVHLVVKGDLSSTDVFIEIVPKGQPMIVSDVDGTLTITETEEYKSLLTGSISPAHPDAAKVLTVLAKKGYRPMYLTARPEYLVGRTREFVTVQGFPAGIIHTTQGLTGALGGSATTFKTDELAWIAAHGLTPAWAFGNTSTDAAAYENAKISPKNQRIMFQFDDTVSGARRIETYSTLLPEVMALPALCPLSERPDDMKKKLLAVSLSAALSSLSGGAEAFSTRLHIVLANDVREALIDGGGTVQLKVGGHVVTWKTEDVDAVLNQPAAFRAGAIGPDNMVFPGMTDPSHAIGVRPYEQCQLLYDAALIPEERAYAMGCFLHGATDAIAHHYVNYMSGETFTLTPITSARQQSFTNVVRHILAEEMIQSSAYASRPTDFASGQLLHAIPKGFVLRTYMDEKSALWAVMAHHSKLKFDAAVAANPGASFVTVLQKSGLAPADHLALAPHYVSRLEAQREALRTQISDQVKAMQNPSTAEGAQLQVKAGPDGKLGTKDDTTACSASCASLYAKYFVYAGLLAPRVDAANQPLPPVFDKVSDKLGTDLRGLLPAELTTIELLSNKLNSPLTPQSSGLGITKTDIDNAFLPMTDWASSVTTLDYESVVQAVAPDWLISTQNTLNALGLNIKVSDIVKAAFSPIIDPIKEGLKQYVVDQAKSFLVTLVDQYDAQKGAIESEYTTRLKKAAGPGLTGTPIDHFYTSGLYLHSFNIAAAALTDHKLVLPVGDDPVGIGPATFDASHTPSWMQAGLCDYLRAAIFPLGIDVKGALTVVEGGKTYAAQVTDDSPVECHDGSLSAFASTPSAAVCSLVDLEALIADPKHDGSVSRAYPPGFGAKAPPCLGLAIPGLPQPPAGTGGAAGAAGGAGASGAGNGGAAAGAAGAATGGASAGGASPAAGAGGSKAGASAAGAAGAVAGGGAGASLGGGAGAAAVTGADASDDGSGCTCAVPGERSRGGAPRGWEALLLAAAVWARWRRRAAATTCAAATTLSLGCGGGDSSDDATPSSSGGAGGTSSAGAAGASGTAGKSGAAGGAGAAGSAGTGGSAGAAGGAGGGGGGGAAGGGGGGAGGATTGGAGGAAGGGMAGASGGGASGSAGAGGQAGQGGSTGSKAAQLLKELGQSTWHGTAPRAKGATTVTRAFQLEFDASSLQWAEIMNPWGPSRARELRVFSVAADGQTLTTTVISPAGWPVSPNNGKKEEFTLKILPGTPRTLELQETGGQKETYTEGPFAPPVDGLTATVNVFSSGKVSDAFCTSGVGGFDYPLIFDFARSKSNMDKLGTDTVAGAKLRTWSEPPGSNSFSVTNVDGFQLHGGTNLSDQFNFFVWYQGTIQHPGGALKIRELDDSVEDGVWAFVGDKVGSANTNDLFLEVHGFPWLDKTPDEASRTLAAGAVDIEVIVVRCAKAIENVDVQVDLGSGWKLLGDVQTKPKLGPTLFPPALF